MKKGNLGRCILIGVGDAILIFLVLIFVRPILHAGETTAQLVKDPTNWALAVFSGVLAVWSVWRKENETK